MEKVELPSNLGMHCTQSHVKSNHNAIKSFLENLSRMYYSHTYNRKKKIVICDYIKRNKRVKKVLTTIFVALECVK